MENLVTVKLLKTNSNIEGIQEIEYLDLLNDTSTKGKIAFHDEDFIELVQNGNLKKLRRGDLLYVHLAPVDSNESSDVRIVDCVHKHYPITGSSRVLKTVTFG